MSKTDKVPKPVADLDGVFPHHCPDQSLPGVLSQKKIIGGPGFVYKIQQFYLLVY